MEDEDEIGFADHHFEDVDTTWKNQEESHARSEDVEEEIDSQSEETIAEEERHEKEHDWKSKKDSFNAHFDEESCKNKEKLRMRTDLSH